MTTIPTWYHKRADIDLAMSHQITTELQAALPIVYPEFDLNNKGLIKGTFHDKIDNNLLRELVPTLSTYLKELGIYDIWEKTALIAATPSRSVPVHRDGTPNFKRLFALNFPIYNCEDSLTSFYEVKDGIEKVEKLIPNNGTPYTKFDINTDDIIKVDSVIVSKPTWLRVNALHSVSMTSDKNRIVASLRFKPEPLDYLNRI
jgi:hypothetical protein